MEVAKSAYFSSPFLFHLLFTIILLSSNPVLSIRFPDRIPELPKDASNQPVKTAVFALGSFWRSEASFGCLNGIVRTTVGYAGGSKPNPEYRNLGDHAECVQVEYDPRVIGFRQLLEVFWASHDSRQVFGQGPDVGNQYRSIIFTNGTEESRLAAVSKEREQSKSKSSIVTTQIQQLEAFYPAEPEHQSPINEITTVSERVEGVDPILEKLKKNLSKLLPPIRKSPPAESSLTHILTSSTSNKGSTWFNLQVELGVLKGRLTEVISNCDAHCARELMQREQNHFDHLSNHLQQHPLIQ